MRPYIRRKNYKFEYSKEMELIMLYLRAHGEVLVSEAGIYKLYQEFSQEAYGAGWVEVSSLKDPVLKEFSLWLDEVEI